MKLTFTGAAHEVTGSCTLMSVCGKNVLIDYGLEQGRDIYENAELPVTFADIDAVFLTHAHIDHSGRLPALAAGGFKGPVFCTHATAKLCGVMLLDSAHIQEFEAGWRNRKAIRSGGAPYVPLYTVEDAQRVAKQFRTYSYEKPFSPFEGMTVTFNDAGHLLGSASILFELCENGEKKSVLFSGDVGNKDRPLIKDPTVPAGADYVIIESTYGDRLHERRKDYLSQLTEIISSTLDRGGNVVIPSFAIGRTQELLYLIRTIKEQGLVKNHGDFPVWVDSPLAVEATGIYDTALSEYLDDQTLALLSRGVNPVTFSNLNFAVSSDDSKAINADNTPKIIISASGMCEAGRIRHHLKHNLWRPESTVLFVGYQVEGSVGRRILDGAKSVKLFGEEIAVNARIESLDGISGHADRDMLLDWLGGMRKKPERVFVNHGSDGVCDIFAKLVEERLGVRATAPYSGDCFDLISGEYQKAPVVPAVDKKAAAKSKADTVYGRLVAAGKRLMRVIEGMRGAANKELIALSDKINAISDKYDNSDSFRR